MINNIEMIFQNNSGFTELIARFFSIMTFILLLMPLHEWIHAGVAYIMSDKTEKIEFKHWYNPVKYIDIIGVLSFFLLGIGWSKPVPVSNLKFRRPKLALTLSALVGPVSYFVFAVITALVYFTLKYCVPALADDFFGEILLMYFDDMVGVNCALAALNLFPIPPLDLSRLWFLVLPEKSAEFLSRSYPVFMLILVLLLLFGILTRSVLSVAVWMLKGVSYLGELPFV